MTSDEIRRTHIEFFEERGHLRLPSSSLIPTEHDPSALFTVAGMHPLKPYFMGREAPPRSRVTTCQKTFRTVDIDIIGTTTRHLTFFEMLGNFSFGDYFKQEAVEAAYAFVTEQMGLDPSLLWATVHEGDPLLGLGEDTTAIEAWKSVGIPEERTVVVIDRYGNTSSASVPLTLHDAITAILSRPEIKTSWEAQGAEPMVMSQPQFAAFMQAEIDKWAKVIKSGALKAN